MKDIRETKKFVYYVLFFIPLILIFLEFSLAAINKFRGIELEGNYNYRYDQLNGWRGLVGEVNEDDPQTHLLNRHTLFETPFEVNANSKNKTKGILISGNSFASGYFPGIGAKNKNSFFSQLETKLRNKKLDIDVVNISFPGYNSWQEHVEIARYLNSSPLHDDLPNIKLVLSFGAVQDFYNFLDLLHYRKDNMRKEYLNANGVMQRLETINYAKNVSLASEGRPLYLIKTFVDSISAFWHKTYTSHYFSKLLRGHKNPINLTKHIVKGLIGGDRWGSYKGKLTIEPKYGLTLNQLITDKYLLTLEEYQEIQEYILSSILRNINATKGILGNIDYVYLYTPTMYNSSSNDINKSQAREVLSFRKMTLKDLQKVEEDFRKKLLERISAIPGVRVIDYSGAADPKTWFMDYTHLNGYGQNKLSELIYSDILETLEETKGQPDDS